MLGGGKDWITAVVKACSNISRQAHAVMTWMLVRIPPARYKQATSTKQTSTFSDGIVPYYDPCLYVTSVKRPQFDDRRGLDRRSQTPGRLFLLQDGYISTRKFPDKLQSGLNRSSDHRLTKDDVVASAGYFGMAARRSDPVRIRQRDKRVDICKQLLFHSLYWKIGVLPGASKARDLESFSICPSNSIDFDPLHVSIRQL